MKFAIDRESVNNALRTISTVVVSLAGAVVLLAILFSLPQNFRIPFAAFLFVIAIIVFFYMAKKNSRENEKIEALLDVLYKECNVEKFIEDSETLISKTKNKRFSASLNLNLALGYEAVGKPVKAIQITKKAKIKAIDKISWAIYYNNLAMFYAEIGDSDNASHALKNAEKYMKKVKKHLPQENYLLTKGMVAFCEGEYKTAKELFNEAKSTGFSNKHTSYLNELYVGKCFLKLDKQREARAIFKRVSQKKTLPYITKAALEQLNNIEAI